MNDEENEGNKEERKTINYLTRITFARLNAATNDEKRREAVRQGLKQALIEGKHRGQFKA